MLFADCENAVTNIIARLKISYVERWLLSGKHNILSCSQSRNFYQSGDAICIQNKILRHSPRHTEMRSLCCVQADLKKPELKIWRSGSKGIIYVCMKEKQTKAVYESVQSKRAIGIGTCSPVDVIFSIYYDVINQSKIL